MSKKAYFDLQPLADQLAPSSGGRGRHSPLFRYIYERADTFKRLLNDKRPAWSAVTEALAHQGFRNGDGQPLTCRRVQKVWYAVVKAKGWPEKQPGAVPQPIAPETRPNVLPTSGTASPQPQTVEAHQAALARMRAQFRPIGMSPKQEAK